MHNDENSSEFVTHNELTEQVTLDQYVARRCGHLRTSDAEEYERRLGQERQELQPLATEGDEWWIWISGTEPLMQQGGLAIVRAGAIVWARMDWLS